MTATVEFWEKYLNTLSATEAADAADRYYCDFQIGESVRSANRSAELLVRGHKTAVCWLWWSMQASDQLPPRARELAIANNGDGKPVAVIEFTEITTVDFSGVDEQFALDYGEWDRTLKTWQKRMWTVFGEACADLGLDPADSMPLVCARFKVVYPRTVPSNDPD